MLLLLLPPCTVQMVHEHLLAFRYNNSIIRQFRVGHIATLLACGRVLILAVLLGLFILFIVCIALKISGQ